MVRRWGRTDPHAEATLDRAASSSDAYPSRDADVASVSKASIAGCVSSGDCVEIATTTIEPRLVKSDSCHAPSSCFRASVTGPDRIPSDINLGPFKVAWIEKIAERVFERREGSLRLDDPVPTTEKSEAAMEYRLRITAFYLRKEGWKKDQIAKKLDRAPGWVTLWWEKPLDEVPRPWDVPKYVADYNIRMLGCGIEPFRPAVLRRRYMTDTAGLYAECAEKMPWRQAVFRKRNYETGGVTVTSIPSPRQDCSYKGLTTGIARLDEALDRVRHDFNITDPRVYLLNNFYPDGNTSIAPHTHDFWSAILSFGASRVFTVDGHPLLLGEGDLLVIGTQRHAVPKMPEVKDGRLSVAIFWYPENKNDFWPALDGSGCAICGRPSVAEDGTEMLQEAQDGNSYCRDCWLEWKAENGDESLEGSADAITDDHLLAAALEMSRREASGACENESYAGADGDGITEDDFLAAALEMSLKDY